MFNGVNRGHAQSKYAPGDSGRITLEIKSVYEKNSYTRYMSLTSSISFPPLPWYHYFTHLPTFFSLANLFQLKLPMFRNESKKNRMLSRQ